MFGYLAATDDSPADKASLFTFIPATRAEFVTGALAALYAYWRWRSTFYTVCVGLAGAKLPVLTGLVLVADGAMKTKRRFADG